MVPVVVLGSEWFEMEPRTVEGPGRVEVIGDECSSHGVGGLQQDVDTSYRPMPRQNLPIRPRRWYDYGTS